MTEGSERVEQRTVGEWAFRAERGYPAPYADVHLDAIFIAPSGRTATMPAFYDGDATWRVRFNPDEPGRWRYRTVARAQDPGLEREGIFEVVAGERRGFLQATPGEAWGFAYEGGEPVFIFGDTVYHLFGLRPLSASTSSRSSGGGPEQGFNLLRVRLPVSPFHPPAGYSHWQTRRTWPWGGSEQAPRFDQFNLDYFRTVDAVVRLATTSGLGLEMIMEGWGFEFPFNSRQIFLPEWEELWLRYLIARYDAFNSVWFWTPLNEYEYYPNGDWNYTAGVRRPLGAPHRPLDQGARAPRPHRGHPQRPAPAPLRRALRQRPDRGRRDHVPGLGTTERRRMAGWRPESRSRSTTAWRGWPGAAVLAEWGYERNPAFAPDCPATSSATGPHPSRRLARRVPRAGHHPRLRELLGAVGGAGRGPAGDGRPPHCAPVLP